MTTKPLHRSAAVQPWPTHAPPALQGPAEGSPAELARLLRSLVQTCADLQRRVDDLECTERLRARRNPPHSLGIDY